MTCKYSRNLARFYDTIYHQLRDSVDTRFFIDQAKKARGKVLEVGTGTGRLFTSLLETGADVYGIDVSDSMLDILKGKLSPEEQFRVSNQNIIDFHFDFKFNLIMAPFRVMMHLTEKEEQLRALENVRDHLEENGIFIFDVFIPDPAQLIKGVDNYMDFEGDYEAGRKIRRFVTTIPDLVNQVIDVKFLLEWDEADGLKNDVFRFPMRFYFRYELEHLLERSGFGKNFNILGDYIGTPLNKNSKEFIVICRR
jgi:SAM-dependent methyltransferase